MSHTLWAIFQDRFLRNQKGGYQTIRLRKALGEMFSDAVLLGAETIPTIPTIPTISAVEISTMENRPRGG